MLSFISMTVTQAWYATEKSYLRVVLAKEAELIKSRIVYFICQSFHSPFSSLPFPFPLPLFFPVFAFAFNKNSTLAFPDGCLGQSKGHALHNPSQKLKMGDVY